MAFGDVLRSLLVDREMTQKDFAAKLNIAASTLGNYIQNSREPDFDTLKRIADNFGVTVDYLLDHPTENGVSPDEERLLCIYRAMTAEQKEMFAEQGKAIVKLNDRK